MNSLRTPLGYPLTPSTQELPETGLDTTQPQRFQLKKKKGVRYLLKRMYWPKCAVNCISEPSEQREPKAGRRRGLSTAQGEVDRPQQRVDAGAGHPRQGGGGEDGDSRAGRAGLMGGGRPNHIGGGVSRFFSRILTSKNLASRFLTSNS